MICAIIIILIKILITSFNMSCTVPLSSSSTCTHCSKILSFVSKFFTNCLLWFLLFSHSKTLSQSSISQHEGHTSIVYSFNFFSTMVYSFYLFYHVWYSACKNVSYMHAYMFHCYTCLCFMYSSQLMLLSFPLITLEMFF